VSAAPQWKCWLVDSAGSLYSLVIVLRLQLWEHMDDFNSDKSILKSRESKTLKYWRNKQYFHSFACVLRVLLIPVLFLYLYIVLFYLLSFFGE